MQAEYCAKQSQKLRSINLDVELAVEELTEVICAYEVDEAVGPISAAEVQDLFRYYNWYMYTALLRTTKRSLNQMKDRIANKSELKPIFELSVSFDSGVPVLTPSLEEVQSAVNSATNQILKATKCVQNWGQRDIVEEQRAPFYDWVAKDKQIVRVICQSTKTINKSKVSHFLAGLELDSSIDSDK